MAYVKLDCGMLDSTTWFDKDGRDIFITALLMATPKEYDDPLPQLEVNSLDKTGWMVPPGWYGFVDAASFGIIARCGIDTERGVQALERLGSPEVESRSQDFDGRRLVRIDGGFLILNYIRYREKDHTAAERQRRYRERQRQKSNGVTSRNITQAEAEAEAEAEIKRRGAKRAPKGYQPSDELLDALCLETDLGTKDLLALLREMKDHEFRTVKKDWDAVYRNWVRRAVKWSKDEKAKGRDSFDDKLKRLRESAGISEGR